METLIKERHTPVYGGKIQCRAQGSKHAFSRIFPSFLLFRNGTLTNVPDILDVHLQVEFMRLFGYEVTYDNKTHTLTYDGYGESRQNLTTDSRIYNHSRSLVNLFPLISKENTSLYVPGGCPIGKRDISWYLEIMSKFGIEFENKGDRLYLTRRTVTKAPENIKIRNRSFSSTNIAISCALERQIKIIIENPSIEPEILDLLEMMDEAGAKIEWDSAYNVLDLDARDLNLDREINFTVMDDRNHVVTMIIGALLLEKKIDILYCKPLQMKPFYELLSMMNIRINEDDDRMVLESDPSDFMSNTNLKFETGPYPKVCSDWQPLLATLAKKGVGIELYEGLFESRLRYLEEYSHLGIQYILEGERSARIFESSSTLPKSKIEVRALDLRCGGGLGLLAMLVPEKVYIHNTVQIRRGYDNYPSDLNLLVGKEVFTYKEEPNAQEQ
ncbi:hypothetical protein CKO25_20450 [Thiocapsa imhoffii]|uniref:UDP-N-acetylglucosamine 1-carboxyvinyltransferase n=1 Tax=Thiocapsa imhoffii TaxID=382777 RepID=A0A9X0WMJ2_9GAMM|nr:hypothetical protein [Thiocapsa imhoffii]MBK1646944.1 hypothetical protein [Thiocapsa imhoffii]